MKVRSVANGNIIDLPEGHGLILAGIYLPVEEDEGEDESKRGEVLRTPEKPVETVAHAELMTTESLPAKKPRSRTAKAAPKTPRRKK